MGMLSEKMSIEREQSASSGSDVPGTFNANTEDGAGTPATAERASPVSSEDSIAERPRSATLGSAAAPDRSEGVSTSNPTALQQAADGIAVLANSVAKHADPAPAEGAKEASPSGRLARAYRSVSREDFDATASRKGTNAAPLDSYQGLEAKIRSDQSAKSSPLHEGSNPDEEAPDPPANDGPPQFITTKPAAAAAASGKRSGKMRRRGKWTVEEEAYVARVIQDFNSGFLDAPAGTTLRTYLSDKLNCDPMRITKKFTGEACIGKRVFHPAIRSPSNAAAIDKAQVCVVCFGAFCAMMLVGAEIAQPENTSFFFLAERTRGSRKTMAVPTRDATARICQKGGRVCGSCSRRSQFARSDQRLGGGHLAESHLADGLLAGPSPIFDQSPTSQYRWSPTQ